MFHVKHPPIPLGYYPHYQLPITGGELNNVKKRRTVSSEKFPKKNLIIKLIPPIYYENKKIFLEKILLKINYHSTYSIK